MLNKSRFFIVLSLLGLSVLSSNSNACNMEGYFEALMAREGFEQGFRAARAGVDENQKTTTLESPFKAIGFLMGYQAGSNLAANEDLKAYLKLVPVSYAQKMRLDTASAESIAKFKSDLAQLSGEVSSDYIYEYVFAEQNDGNEVRQESANQHFKAALTKVEKALVLKLAEKRSL